MDIIEVNGKKYIRQVPEPAPVSDLFRPISETKPINIITPIKPIFVCIGQCDKCKDKKCFTI